MERIGIFGGSFDPPHIGHMQAARQAIEALRLDRLLMIPARIAPHKQGSVAELQHRLAMLRIASEGLPNTTVSDLELQREGTSYTYETVAAVREEHPDAEIFLLMGSDMLISFQNWKHPEKILAQVTLAVFCRGSKGEKTAIAAKKAELEAQGHEVLCLENKVGDISSTQIYSQLVNQKLKNIYNKAHPRA